MKVKKILILFICFALLAGCSLNFRNDPELIRDADKLSTVVNITLPTDVMSQNNIDQVRISSYLVNGSGIPMRNNSATVDVLSSASSVEYDVQYFGRHELTIELLSSGKTKETILRDYVVTAPEYNIAVLSATVPVTYFSLLAADTSGSELLNPSYPSIVALERAASYDWNNLLPNMYDCPFLKKSVTESASEYKDLYPLLDAMSEYVKYLHELDSSSIFNVYLNETGPEFFLRLLADNGIDFTKSKIVLFSDGTYTYSNFRGIFGSGGADDDSMNTYQDLYDLWIQIKNKALSGDDSFWNDINTHANNKRDWRLRELPPILINDPDMNVYWVVSRNNADVFGTSAVYTEKVAANPRLISSLNMNTLLTNLEPAEKDAFQKLFNMNVEQFEKADEEGKKIMIFLGTRGDQDMHLDEFLSFMTNYFGSGYSYFYKGHPGDLTAFNDSRAGILEKYGVENLEASIPAELFYFFRNDVVMGGFSSSTFQNLPEMQIPFISFNGNRGYLEYEDRIGVEIYLDGGEFRIMDMTSKKICNWDPNNPTVFDWN